MDLLESAFRRSVRAAARASAGGAAARAAARRGRARRHSRAARRVRQRRTRRRRHADLGGLEMVVNHVLGAAAAPMAASALARARVARAVASHSSLANVCLAAVCAATGIHVHDAVLHTSADETRVRAAAALRHDRARRAPTAAPLLVAVARLSPPNSKRRLPRRRALTRCGPRAALSRATRRRAARGARARRCAAGSPRASRGTAARAPSCAQAGRRRAYLDAPARASHHELRALSLARSRPRARRSHPQLHGRFVKQNDNKALERGGGRASSGGRRTTTSRSSARSRWHERSSLRPMPRVLLLDSRRCRRRRRC